MSKLQLYAKVTRLFLGKNIVTPMDIGSSYSRVSTHYPQTFLGAMHRYNDEMIGELGRCLDSDPACCGQLQVLDLAAGTGYNSLVFRQLFPAAVLTLVDISPGMLAEARKNLPEPASFVTDDMLHYLENCPDQTFDAVLCGWALKYRPPQQIIRQCRRILKAGGHLAVIVNKKDTLPQVAGIYPQLLAKHTEKIGKLMLQLPNPKDLQVFDNWFLKNSFAKIVSKEGFHDFVFGTGRELAEFVVSTGALAGFDVMLNLRDPEIQADMAGLFQEHRLTKATHRFVYGVYRKSPPCRWTEEIKKKIDY